MKKIFKSNKKEKYLYSFLHVGWLLVDREFYKNLKIIVYKSALQDDLI
jgi:hypothetical protein